MLLCDFMFCLLRLHIRKPSAPHSRCLASGQEKSHSQSAKQVNKSDMHLNKRTVLTRKSDAVLLSIRTDTGLKVSDFLAQNSVYLVRSLQMFENKMFSKIHLCPFLICTLPNRSELRQLLQSCMIPLLFSQGGAKLAVGLASHLCQQV